MEGNPLEALIAGFDRLTGSKKKQLFDRLHNNQEVPNEIPQSQEIITSKIEKEEEAPETNRKPAADKEAKSNIKMVWTKKSGLKVVVLAIELGNNTEAGRRHGLSESAVRKWRMELANEPEVVDLVKKKKKKKGQQGRGKFHEIEKKVFE